jgi:hypothetical protein
MSAVDQLLIFLLEDHSTASRRMAAAGYSEELIRDACGEARRLGFTEATGLGADRLTSKGKISAGNIH